MHYTFYILYCNLHPISRCPTFCDVLCFTFKILLSVRCITPYILDLTVHLTSYILRSASHFLPFDLHPGSDTDERKVLYHTLYGHFIYLNPISDIINSSSYIYCSSSICDPMGYNLHTAFYIYTITSCVLYYIPKSVYILWPTSYICMKSVGCSF